MAGKSYYVYIVASKSRVLYVGFTSNIEQRILQHRAGAYGGFTSRYRVDRLVYLETYSTPQDAITREKELKRWVRAKKIALIEAENPLWDDISADWFRPAPTRTIEPTSF